MAYQAAIEFPPSRTPLPPSLHLPDIWTTLERAGIQLSIPEVPCLAPRVPPPPPVALHESNLSMANRKRKHFKRTLFTPDQRDVLTDWLHGHHDNPYPSASEKEHLMLKTGLHREQLNVWFTNHRMREGLRAGADEVPHRFHS